MATQREQSKKEWTSRDTNEDLQIRCLQRIADATEIMASNYVKLQNNCDYYKKMYHEKLNVITQKDKSISNLKGQITKLKNNVI